MRKAAGIIRLVRLEPRLNEDGLLRMTDNFRPFRSLPFLILRLGASLLLVIAAIGACGILKEHLPQPYLPLVFLVAVVVSAAAFGLGAGITAAFASFFAYNFFFIPPTYTLAVADPREFVALVAFLLVALLTGGLAGRLKENAAAAEHRARLIQSLYDYSGQLAGTASLDEARTLVCQKIETMLNCRVALILRGDTTTGVEQSSAIGTLALESINTAKMDECLKRTRSVSDHITGPQKIIRDYYPLPGTKDAIGVVVTERISIRDWSEIESHALQSLIKQAGIAIERLEYARQTEHAILQADQERLRSAILSSLSHDLRTPLASILGSATALRQLGRDMTEDDRDDLLIAIEEEALRLNLFVSNLLAMTRLETGAIDLKSNHVDCAERLNAAVERARRNFPQAQFRLLIAEDLGDIRGDAVLLEQVIFNLLDNAIKFGGSTHPVTIRLIRNGERIRLAVEDEGPGIAPTTLEQIFEKFYRDQTRTQKVSGFGLGLAIGRGVVSAMGGTLHAESPISEGKGARFVLELPMAEA